MDIITTVLSTPLGDMIAGAMHDGLCLLEFHDRKMLSVQKERLTKHLDGQLVEGSHSLFQRLETQLNMYFSGDLKNFEIPLIYPGSAFQIRVWESLLKIPYGTTRSYAQQSELIGDPKAIRAMAKANGDNRIAIIIPCHRVIGSNGEMTGYGGKVWRKKQLLELEGALARQGELFE